MVMKHSYLINKDFVLCILAEDKNFFYGEILYGAKKIRGVNTTNIRSIKYYKYWQLCDRKIGGSYDVYFKKVKVLYPNEKFNHDLIGKLFRVNKSRSYKILYPKNVKHLPKRLHFIICQLTKFLSINIKNIYFGGSLLLNESKKNLNDIDLIISGLNNNKKISKKISIIVRKNKFGLDEPNSLNRRRFRYKKERICPFGVYKYDNFFEKNFIKKGNKIKIFAEVIDNSYSLLSPAIYKIKINGKIFYLLSYFVGHVKLLNIGDNIELKASPCFFNNKKISFAYVIPIQGCWIKILSS